MKKLQVKLTALLTTVLLAASATAFVACSDEDEESTNYSWTETDYTLEHYTITVNSATNGTVTANPTSSIAGRTVPLTLTPNDGYEFGSLSVTDASNTAISTKEILFESTSQYFTMPESNVTVSATFTEKAAVATKSKPDAVGDVVLSDGTAVSAANASSMNPTQKAKAVAVIFYVGTGAATSGSNDNILGAKTLGVGLQKSDSLAWCVTSADGYNKSISNISCKQSLTKPESGIYYTNNLYAGTAISSTNYHYLTGDFDGSNNWTALCDAVNDESTSGNYPAWEWVNSCAENNGLSGNYASGWYMPTAVELLLLMTNRTKNTVNTSLEAAGGTKLAFSYWSSNHYAYNSYNFYALTAGTSAIQMFKESTDSVCAIRAF